MLTEEQVLAAIRKSGVIDSEKSIDIDADFKSMGIDSLDVFNVLLEIEAIVGEKIPDEDVDTLTTPRAILDYVNLKA